MQEILVLKKLRNFYFVFLVLFIFSPLAYTYVSITETNKRTDYPGKKISQIVQKKWENNFSNQIVLVGGDEWHGGNLSYHLESRPKWKSKLQQKPNTGTVWIKNFNEINNCEGVLYQIEPFNDICMLGKK